MSGLNLSSVGFVGSLGGGAAGATTPLVYQENNAAITYSGTWAAGVRTSFYGAGYAATTVVGATFQLTVPAGYTGLSMQGHKDTGGSYFTLKRNGVVVVNTDQYDPGDVTGEYLKTLANNRLAVAAGDVILFTRTNSNFTTDATGGVNVACFCDQITFHP